MQFVRKKNFYEKWLKRPLDIICAVLFIIFFWWLFLIIAVLVRFKLGKPILFCQPRPGLIDPCTNQEKIFNLYKFRTMSNEKKSNGEFLPDEMRLGKFGKILRATSLDEIPEVFNILIGDMSFIGPRPQLVRDMVFMTNTQRMRHTVRPGLSGLAQVNGRNAISWEEKLKWDLKYIEKISLWKDIKLVWMTLKKIVGKEESADELNVALDYGDALLKTGKVSHAQYTALQGYAENLIAAHNMGERK